jgi:ferredoxin-type protein NapH
MKWLLLRRLCQLSILGLFLLGPVAGLWILRGDLAGSKLLGFIPLSDPLTLLQTMLAGHLPAATSVVGMILVLALYLAVGGRAFCAWVCPVNIITDTAAWLQRKLGIKTVATFGPVLRYWLLGLVLVMAFFSGAALWEDVNPVNVTARSLIFFLPDVLWMVLLLFAAALLIRGGWCRICPTGALYALLGRFSLFRVHVRDIDKCDNCQACYQVCPEPQVLVAPLKHADHPVIDSGCCSNCGRCIDVCPHGLFRFDRRFKSNTPS